jgi:hypothetical protein
MAQKQISEDCTAKFRDALKVAICIAELVFSVQSVLT